MNKTKSRFLKVKCKDCGNEQVVFGSAASDITCLVCDKILVSSTGGKAEIKTSIIEVADKEI